VKIFFYSLSLVILILCSSFLFWGGKGAETQNATEIVQEKPVTETPPETKEIETIEEMLNIPFDEEPKGDELFPISPSFHVILDPVERTILSAEVSALVEKITRKMGEPFKKGDLLIQLENDIFRAKVEEEKANVEKARATLNAKRELYRDDIASLTELKTAEYEAERAVANLILAQKNLSSSTILAPYSGKLVTRFIQEHELAQEAKELIEIVDDEILVAKILIPSKMWREITLGQPVKINITETGEVVEGKIARIGAVIDPSSNTIKIDVEINNRDGRLRAGMTGTTTLEK
jgi:RND family efflux transporter MFP subunit